MHAVGGGDLGPAGERDFTAAIPDLADDPRALGKSRRPLRKLFEGLAEAGIPVSSLVLLGTTGPGGPGDRSFAEWADQMRARLISKAGLCGRRFDPCAVSVVRVEAPTLQDATQSLAREFTAYQPGEILISCGSGAFALSASALCAALETRRPARIVHIDTPGKPFSLDRPRDTATYLESWLVRYRFWDAMAEIETDPAGQVLWKLLAARQAGDTRTATMLDEGSQSAGLPGLAHGVLLKFAESWPTAQAALFERIGRGEAADFGLLRAWYAQQMRRLFRKDREILEPQTRERLSGLIDALGDRDGGEGGLSGKIRATAGLLATDGTSASVRMVNDAALTELYTAASTHRAHLMPERLVPGPLPPTLRAAADQWEKSDAGVRLLADTGRTGWPVLGSGDVLGLLAVGLDREGRDAEDCQAVQVVLAELRRRRELPLRRGTLRLRLLAGAETADRARRLASWGSAQAPDVDVRVIEDVTGDLERIRDVVAGALRSEAAPTGRTGSGSLRDVDEVMLVLNPGPPMTNYGMIAAGVEWSLTAACPLWVTELVRGPGAGSELRGGQPVLARLGTDQVLARLAMSAVGRLDLRTARRLIDRGSGRLRAVLPELEKLERDSFAPWEGEWTEEQRLAVARRRLSLIAETHRAHPDLAAYLAIAALRPALFSWTAWKRLCDTKPALRDLRRRANLTLQGHVLDRGYQGKRRGATGQDDVFGLIKQAVRQLGRPNRADDVLIHQRKAVMDVLDGLYRESG